MADTQFDETLNTYRVTVEIEFQGYNGYKDHELFGPQVTAKRFASMATDYASIGATKSEVLSVEEID